MNNKEKEALAEQLRGLLGRFELCCGTVCDKASIVAELKGLILRMDPCVPVSIKPDWSRAPKWASWWAVDFDGVATWFERRPVMFCNRWCSSFKNRRIGQHAEAGHQGCRVVRWSETLTHRPEAT